MQKSLTMTAIILAREQAMAAAPTDCTQDLTDLGTVAAYYDPQTQLVNLEATLPVGSYAGWGWGPSMTDTEMLIFSASDGASDINFYLSSGFTKPTLDASFKDCYTTSVTQDGDTVNFTATRPLECTAVADSYVVQLDTELSLITAWNPTNS